MNKILIIAFVMLIPQCINAQSKKINKIQQELQYFLDTIVNNHPEIYNSIFMVHTPSGKYKVASGYADPERNIKMQVNHQFFSASTTKMMTACLIMLLQEQGKLNILDPINKYLPDTLLNGLHTIEGNRYEHLIIIKHLLNHTSGLSDNWNEEFMGLITNEPMKVWNPVEVIKFTKDKTKPQFKPGEGFNYADPGYILLGLIIEKVTGMELHQACRKMLLEPIGLNNTYWQHREEPIPGPEGQEVSHCFIGETDYTNMKAISADWAGGGMRTTCEDLNTFMQAFINDKIFKYPSTKDQMFEWIKISEEDYYYGLGIIKQDLNEKIASTFIKDDIRIGHHGVSGAFMYYFQNRKLTITGTLNQMYTNVDFNKDMIFKIIEILDN